MPPERLDLSSSNPPSTSPPSLPMSMQSSFESEAAFGLPPSSVVSPTSVTGPLSPVGPGGPLQLTSIQEYNLQQLASLAEREQAAAVLTHSPPLPPTAATATTPSSNPSPTPSSFSLADLFSGDPSSASHAINNLQALAKLGSVSLNNHGKLSVQFSGLCQPSGFTLRLLAERHMVKPEVEADFSAVCA